MVRGAGMAAIEYVLAFDPNAVADGGPHEFRYGSSLVVKVGRTCEKFKHSAGVVPLDFHKRVVITGMLADDVSVRVNVNVDPRSEQGLVLGIGQDIRRFIVSVVRPWNIRLRDLTWRLIASLLR